MVTQLSEVSILEVDIRNVAVVTPYIMVWGSLRTSAVNHKQIESCTLVGTYILPGWIAQGIAGYYTGSPKDNTVVDLFKVRPNNVEAWEDNLLADRLEGITISSNASGNQIKSSGYRALLMRIKHPITNETIFVKMYNFVSSTPIESDGKVCDYFNRVMNTDELPMIEII